MTIQIDDEFKALIPPLSTEEFTQLEANILADGCRDALVVWNNTLIDGHNRYTICEKHSLPYQTVSRDFDSREDAIVWIVTNQLGRRNLTAFVRGELALRMKEALTAIGKSNMSAGGKGLQNFANLHNTRSEIAKSADVSHETIRKVELVAEQAPEPIKQKAREGELSVDRAYRLTKALEDTAPEIQQIVTRYNVEDVDTVEELKRIHKAAPETFKEVYNSGYIQPGEETEAVHIGAGYKAIKGALATKSEYHAVIGIQRGAPKALQMSVSNEWYTPKEYLEAVHLLMGGIDTDPASNPIANQVVRAATYYTVETNGLDKPWIGRVWLNPPYGKEDGESNQDRWSARLIEQYKAGITTEAVLLVNAVTDRKWFQPLWDYPICFTRERIKFYDENGEAGQPTHGNVFVYFGSNVIRFAELFGQWGRIVVPQGAMSEVLPIAA